MITWYGRRPGGHALPSAAAAAAVAGGRAVDGAGVVVAGGAVVVVVDGRGAGSARDCDGTTRCRLRRFCSESCESHECDAISSSSWPL